MRLILAGLRRLITVLLGVAVGALGLHLLLTQWGLVSLSLAIPQLDGRQLQLLGGAALTFGVAVAFIGLHVSREPSVFRLSSVALQPGGTVTVNQRAVIGLVMSRAQEVEGVAECRVRKLKLSGAKWRLSCDVVVYPDTALKQAAEQVRGDVSAALERHTGVPVDRMDVRSSLATAADGKRVR